MKHSFSRLISVKSEHSRFLASYRQIYVSSKSKIRHVNKKCYFAIFAKMRFFAKISKKSYSGVELRISHPWWQHHPHG